MPWLFSYGSLQRGEAQIETFGHRVESVRDALPGFARVTVAIADPARAAVHGATHHANLVPSSTDGQRIEGTALHVTDDELTMADRYEALDGYARIEVSLASGRRAWMYVHDASKG